MHLALDGSRYGEGRREMLTSVTGIFACLQLMVAAAHLSIPRVAGIMKDLEVNRRILIVYRFVDRPLRQVNHGPAKPAEHPCRQTIILDFAHSSEMRGEWSGLQEEVSIKSTEPLIASRVGRMPSTESGVDTKPDLE